jgi:NADPH:quinone reductase-like Zn-dependent oxidoreductase
MKAIRIHEYGGPDVLKYEEAPKPEIGPGELLVLVHAVGVNPLDARIRGGVARERLRHSLPLVPGWDVSGTVEAAGADVSAFRPGDEIYARTDILRNGAYAEYISIRADEAAPKPRSIDHVHAAAVPLACLAAWQALFDAPIPSRSAALAPGQTILVHGAAGGVGAFAVQLAKWRGVRVIGTASARNLGLLRDLGVDQPVDYTRQPFEQVVRDVDAVLDTIGGETLVRSWLVLKKGGVLVSLVEAPSEAEAQRREMRASHVLARPNAVQLGEIARLIDDEIVRPLVSETFPLADARRAHERVESGHTRAKLVLRVHG